MRIAVVLGGEAWEGECSGGNEVKTLGSGFSPWGFVLLFAVGDTGAPAPSPWSPAPGTVCPHMPSLASTEMLVISSCPLLACGKKSLLSLGMLSPKTAAALLWGSAHSLFAVADRNQTPRFRVDFIHQQPAGAGI